MNVLQIHTSKGTRTQNVYDILTIQEYQGAKTKKQCLKTIASARSLKHTWKSYHLRVQGCGSVVENFFSFCKSLCSILQLHICTYVYVVCVWGGMLVTTGACEIQMKGLGPLELNLVGKCKLVGLVTSRHERHAGERTSESWNTVKSLVSLFFR